jgi:hypothetical protein
MRESLLHYVWRTRRIDTRRLISTTFQTLEILDPGEYNTDAGPDFFNARIRIGDTEWAGNVEMHVRASEWDQHGHQHDRAYDNVILHVVYVEDKAIYLPSGERLVCLEIRDRLPTKLMEKYRDLEQAQTWISCAPFLRKVPEIIRLNWFDRMMVERLEQKTEAVARVLKAVNQHWEEAFYRLLARSFGLKVNSDPFESLARSIPLNVIIRHKNSLFQVEALLFGQSGLLSDEFKDEYPQALLKEYKHLALKYGLTPLQAKHWKFSRLRPAGFPTVRLAQFAAFLHQSEHLFSQVLEAPNARNLEHLFSVQVSAYWLDHFQFDKPSIHAPKNLGRDFVDVLILNTIAPVLFYYGKSKQLQSFQDKALRLLESLPPESNNISEGWTALGVKPVTAYQSQALLQLKNCYCDEKRCFDCAIGHAILK